MLPLLAIRGAPLAARPPQCAEPRAGQIPTCREPARFFGFLPCSTRPSGSPIPLSHGGPWDNGMGDGIHRVFFLPNEPNFPPWRYRKRCFPHENEPKRTQNEPNKRPKNTHTNPNEPKTNPFHQPPRGCPIPLSHGPPWATGWGTESRRATPAPPAQSTTALSVTRPFILQPSAPLLDPAEGRDGTVFGVSAPPTRSDATHGKRMLHSRRLTRAAA